MELSQLEGISFAGVGLNVAEKATLEVAMGKAKHENNLDELLFWGKIYGTTKNYLVCVGTKKTFSGVPEKKFFFCNGSRLVLLPGVTSDAAAVIQKAEGKDFTGNAEASLDVDSAEDGAEALTEIHRLSAKVRVRT